MPRARHQVRPHPETVTQFSKDELEPRRRAKAKSTPVTVRRVASELVWEAALGMAKRDHKRLLVLDFNTILILNPGVRPPDTARRMDMGWRYPPSPIGGHTA